jgi:DNA-damage-inducible protein D
MMSKSEASAISGKAFEKIKRINAFGAEYWSARDLQTLLGYTQWRRFDQAIQRALGSCAESGNPTGNHFAGAGKMVSIGSGSGRELEDVHLSRFACYLIAQNGDPRKPEIALAQQYFAVQTRRQELHDQAAADRERLELRKQASQEFKALSSAAQLAANQFRMTQARDKLERKNVKTQSLAIKTHELVGKEVRAAIRRIGGVLPENMSPAEHIKEVEKRVKKQVKQLELGGLSGKGVKNK